jgi:phage I-like protein
VKGRRLLRLRQAANAGELVAFSLSAGDKPPTEFRIFAAGWNDSRKGQTLFDDTAARALMAEYAAHGADVMIDLEHLSLDDEGRNFDPDARGWCKLELRKGELWAVDVRWTPDGEERLREKRQRYISPTFARDPKTKRPTELVNIALTALPATDKLTPLVAARARSATGGTTMKVNAKVLAALGLPEDADEKTVAAAMAEAMKDPAKLVALLSGMWDADDAAEGDEGGEGGEGGGEDTQMSDAGGDAGAAPAAKPGTAPGAPVKKMTTTTEYHRGAGGRRAAVAGVSTADELAAEVLALRVQVNGSTIRELIQANRTKFTPALETWAQQKFADDVEGLKAWLKAAPIVANGQRLQEKRHGAGGASGGGEVKLTREDVEMCRLTHRDPKEFLKHKRELKAGNDPDALTALIDEEG